MKTLRTALLALTVALTVAGGAGAVSNVDAPAGQTSITPTKSGGGSSWCC